MKKELAETVLMTWDLLLITLGLSGIVLIIALVIAILYMGWRDIQ